MTELASLRSLVQAAALLRPERPHQVATREAGPATQGKFGEEVTLGGVPVKLLEREQALKIIIDRARDGGSRPLAVASANLDHVKHFGQGGRWADTLDHQASVEWLTLLDGSPLVSQAEMITERKWPRLSGSDLILPLLDVAETAGLRVGIVGGTGACHDLIREKFTEDHPGLTVSGLWAPERSSLADAAASHALAAEISKAGTDVLVVCLGKPRQELWISEFGQLTGAKVLLAFGAVVDFLAGRVRRAPARVSDAGLEWAWRLALEPRRLARRYLVDGPEAYLKLRRCSRAGHQESLTGGARSGKFMQAWAEQVSVAIPGRVRGFSGTDEHTDVAVLVVTYNSEKDIAALLESLRPETADQSIKVIVADNSPSPSTLSALKDQTDVFAFPTGGNLGYAAAINAAVEKAGATDAYLILNPDMRVVRGSVRALRDRMALSGAGVVVPLLFDDDGTVYPSLRREPSVSRAIGDALLGSKLPGRPAWLSEMDSDPESYLHAHKIDWATGAALLIRHEVAGLVGNWEEEYFLYSEETDYLRRVREAGATVWFEPLARMEHSRGGSGSSFALDALMTVNRIRYVRKFHSAGYACGFQAAVMLAALLRSPLPGGKEILSVATRERLWEQLPHATRYPATATSRGGFPTGAVIIPAHNEEAVLRRTLKALAIPLASGAVEVIVACNACTDGTEAIAKSFAGVQVVRITEASKVAALNAGDRAATLWPRVYLDADIELPAEALSATFEQLAGDGTIQCARPQFTYNTDGASWPVRAYYRARNRLPKASESMWGAGVYGLNRRGHERFGEFPPVIADDCYIDRLFDSSEKTVLPCPPVIIRTPRSTRALIAVLRRVYRGNSELRAMPGAATGRTVRQLLGSAKTPGSVFDAAVYAAFALLGRQARPGGTAWERDDSSRPDLH
ncbi:exopolysaccharide biosynthesis protein, WecB/TagA/CpsF family [Pseudarthrobacter phenanthrenivorans Sphe3]|uniref:Exopolysaccharide biosynthesis protein, WecB/TagA/CpsF family n=1 Tax=Pseudarthrobacter phenanthrenivorans (strain DSM 18606 / JCM 16027 / LMG 23796 / Sphe3) TaxID=930171 RepID=F0MA52_PSEPM|nr:WecB/TagA/CpsF family glycosyltransferase [Pseudarthrobacter phenanthrenivorans]ADX75039.1 exopolysaccharide biosynthesis protein, WecB/TagA/CpsF family [Pseudarthrobacter phenanthrenivorans Sphe3]